MDTTPRLLVDMGVVATCDDASSSELLETFPTTHQAVPESFLKEMMLALRSSIQQGFTAAFNKHMSAINDLAEGVDHVENKMGEFYAAHNGLVYAHNHLELTPYVQQMIKTILPSSSKQDLMIDRAHRLPKPMLL